MLPCLANSSRLINPKDEWTLKISCACGSGGRRLWPVGLAAPSRKRKRNLHSDPTWAQLTKKHDLRDVRGKFVAKPASAGTRVYQGELPYSVARCSRSTNRQGSHSNCKTGKNHTKYWKSREISDKCLLLLVIFKWTVLLKWMKFSVKLSVRKSGNHDRVECGCGHEETWNLQGFLRRPCSHARIRNL